MRSETSPLHSVVRPDWTLGCLFIVVLGSLTLSAAEPANRSPAPWLQENGCPADEFEPDDTCSAGNAAAFDLGEVQSRTLCDNDWVSFEVFGNTTYRIEATPLGEAGDPQLELWMGDSECLSLVARSDENDGEPGAYIEWQAPGFEGWTGFVGVRPPAGELPANPAYDLAVRCIARCMSYFVPFVQRRLAADGTRSQSEVWIFNPNREQVTVQAHLSITGSDPAEQRPQAEVAVAAGETVRLVDVVGGLFGDLGDAENAGGVTGALELETAGAEIMALSRSFTTRSDGGTFGRLIEAVRRDRAAARTGGDWEEAVLFPIIGSRGLRSDLGLCETAGRATAVDLELEDHRGRRLARETVELPAFGHLEIADALAFFGIEQEIEVAQVAVFHHDPDARVLGYTTMVDLASGDTTHFPGAYFPGINQPDPWSSAKSYPGAGCRLPVVAAATGARGTTWSSDMWALFLWWGVNLEMAFIPAGPGVDEPQGIELPGESDGLLEVRDVVQTLGGSGVGAVDTSCHLGMYLLSRTANLTADGSFGQMIPSLDSRTSSLAAGARTTAVGATSSAGFRSNVGFYCDLGYGGEVVIRLISAVGEMLGEGRYPITARHQHTQVNDIFRALGVPPADSCRVEFDLEGGDSYEVYGYLSVVDNHTGDAMFVPARRVPVSSLPVLTLDNRRNAVLVDRLEAAQGVPSVLTAGAPAELELTVTGSGDLGRDDLPLRVACLWRSGSSSAPGVTGSVLDLGTTSQVSLAGGSPLWCFIPDWISKADNTGSATVTLTGEGLDPGITLELDATGNCVLMDQLAEAVVEPNPAGIYSVRTTGHSGAAGSRPLVLLMYRDDSTRELVVRASSRGGWISPVAITVPLLAVVLDLENSADNLGRSLLEPLA